VVAASRQLMSDGMPTNLKVIKVYHVRTVMQSWMCNHT